MAKITNTFRFTGTFKSMEAGKDLRTITSAKNPNWEGKELTFKVKTDSGTQLVKLFGGQVEGQSIKTSSKEKDKDGKYIVLSIPFESRLEKDVIDVVASFRKIKILEKEFITEIDAIEYITNNLIDFEDKRVIVSGAVEVNEYNDKIYTKYYVKAIYEAKDEQKDGFNGSMALYINKDSISEEYRKGNDIDLTLIKKDRKIPLTIFTEVYNKDKSTKDIKPYFYIPMTVFISLSDKFDFDNEAHLKSLNFKLKTMMIKKGVHEIGWEVRFHKGSEKTEITMEDLTNFEKAQIENNVKTFEEIVKGKQSWGEFTEEIQLIKFHSNYVDGLIETTLLQEDLEWSLVDDSKSKSVEKAEDIELEQVEDDDLF